MAKTTQRGTPFNGTQMRFTKPSAAAPGVPITNLTAANPARATATAHGLVNGDAIYVSSAANPSVNGLYAVSSVIADSFNVVGLDGETKGAASDATFAKLDINGFCFAKSIDITPATVDYKDVTLNCDDYPHEEGNLKAGDIKLEILWDGDDPLQRYFEELMFSQEAVVFSFKPKNKNIMRAYAGTVSAWSFKAQSNDSYTGSLTIKLKSRPMDIDLTTP